MIDDPSQSEEKASRVEGRGCVFGRQVVFGYPPETETQVQFRVSTKSGELQYQPKKEGEIDEAIADCFDEVVRHLLFCSWIHQAPNLERNEPWQYRYKQ